MKQQIKRLAAVLGLVSLVALAGCGGGSGTSSSGTTSVSGVVADGYLVGAKVCLDKNNNKKCDAGEPSATTTAGGSYTLSDVSSADIATYPMLVEVTTSATDAERGPVTAGYVLTAPAGKTAFISPLTTLIQNQVETTGVTPEVAEATIRNSLGLSASTSLFADFKPADANATTEQKLAASVAKVIATTIATNKTAIETAVGASNTTVDAVVKLIVQQVMQQLPTVLQQVQTSLVNGTLPESAVSNVVSASSLAVDTSNTTTLQNSLSAVSATTTISDLVAAMTGGSYWIERYQTGTDNSGNPVYTAYYGKNVYTSSTNLVAFSQYWLSGSSWQIAGGSEIYLTSSGWQVENGTGGSYNPATGEFTSAGGGEKAKVSLVKYDVSGKTMSSYLTTAFQGTRPSSTFPAGSEAYRFTMTNVTDTYRLSEQVCSAYDNSGSCTTPITNLTTVLSTFTRSDGRWWGDGLVAFYFGTATSSTSGTLELYSQDVLSSSSYASAQRIATSTYQIKTVNGVQILVADLRPAGGSQKIFAVYNGQVYGGEFNPANVARLDSSYNFNKIAVNAIAAAVGFPAIP